MKNIFLTFILSAFLPCLIFAKHPSTAAIKKWLNQSNFSVDKIQTVFLSDNERAFLAEVSFTGTQSLIKQGLVLVRPELDEAEFIPPFAQDYILTDLDHDGITEIIFSQEFDYDTYTLFKRFIVQLHEYQRYVLYSVEYKEEKKCNLCLVEDIQWGFEDINQDKIKDLKQDYVLYVQGKQKKFTFKQKLEELEFNTKGLRLPFRQADLRLGSIQIAKDVIDREAINPSRNFSLSDEKVYCLLDFEDVKKEESITYHWIHEKLGRVLKVEQKVHPTLRFRTWLYKSLNEKEKYIGNWIVIVTDKYMNLLASKEFSITQ